MLQGIGIRSQMREDVRWVSGMRGLRWEPLAPWDEPGLSGLQLISYAANVKPDLLGPP